ncbi:MAG: NAD(P)H-dependent glycerol-3-phosphate dehydrogenase [Actinomycetota bacterium]
MKNVSIVGAGAMGTALAINFDRAGKSVTLCATSFDDSFVEAIEKTGVHPSLAHEVPGSIAIVRPPEWGPVMKRTDIAVLAVASGGVRSTLAQISGTLPETSTVLVATKGWDPESAEQLSILLARSSPGHPLAFIVGPTLAGEIAGGRPTALVCASASLHTAQEVADFFSSPTLRIFVTDDVVGVEVGAALKNVIAVAIGMCDGLAESGAVAFTNAKAALFSQGLIEMSRLARALGGREETVLGLTGSGDLFVTVMGGRNGQFGRLIGSGVKPDDALAQMATTVEGFEGSVRAVLLAERLGVHMPLVQMVYSVLYGGVEPSAALVSFFSTWTDSR